MGRFKWQENNDLLVTRVSDPMDAKKTITFEIRLEKHGGWWYKVYKNGQFLTHGAAETRRQAQEAAEELMSLLITYVDTDYALKWHKRS